MQSPFFGGFIKAKRAQANRKGAITRPLDSSQKTSYNLIKRDICVLKMANIVYFSCVSRNNDLIKFDFFLPFPLLPMILFHPSNINSAHHILNILYFLYPLPKLSPNSTCPWVHPSHTLEQVLENVFMKCSDWSNQRFAGTLPHLRGSDVTHCGQQGE